MNEEGAFHRIGWIGVGAMGRPIMALKVASATGSSLPISQSVYRTLVDLERGGFGQHDVVALADSAKLLAAGSPTGG